MEYWFNVSNTETAIKHRNAYNKSVKEKRCIKVHAGVYYYKGYEVFENEGSEYRWSWKNVKDLEGNPCCTKRDCIEEIDIFLGDKIIDICDLICR